MALKAIFAVSFILGTATCVAGMVIISAGDLPTPPNECARGPEYWCSDIRSAKQCHATKHCIQTVWERQSVPEDDDSICQICKEMVQEARDTLMSNDTQEGLREVLEGSCKLIPIKMVRLNCVKIVDDFIPELLEMLSSEMNPTVVCTTALLCNNAWCDGLQAEYKAARLATSGSTAVKVQPKCETCQRFMSHNSNKLKKSSMDDIQSVLFNACDSLSSYSDGCKALVDDHMDKIHKYLSTSLDENSCQPLGFCDGQTKPMRVSVQPKSNDRKFQARFEAANSGADFNDDLECDFCQTLVKNVRDILISNTSESEFVQVLNGLCKQTGTFAKECQSLVAEYGDVAYAFFMHELDPLQACRLMTLCPSSKNIKSSKGSLSYMKIQPKDIQTATKLIPAKRIVEEVTNDMLVGQDEGNAIRASDFSLPSEILVPVSLTPRKPTCILCEYVLHQIVEELHNVTIQKEVEDVVKNICKSLPPSVGDECGKLIDTYADAIFFLLSQELDPSTMCVSLEMCSASRVTEVALPTNPFSVEVDDPNTCALCEFVISTLDKKLQDNKTEESIRAALESVCDYMPSSIRKDCVRLVDAYSKQIVEALLAELTPDEVCAALKLCNPKNEENISEIASGITVGEFLAKVKQDSSAKSVGVFLNEIKKESASKDSATCIMCEYAMSALEKQLINNNTEDEVKRAIDFLCARLPSTVADMCIDFVEQYGDEIFDLLMSEYAPKTICTQLGLCGPAAGSAVPRKALKLGHKNEHVTSNNNVNATLPNKCEICQIVVEYLDKLLEDDTIEESIDHIIEKACTIVPHGVKDKCTTMVETYGPYLISQLGELMDKAKVCQSVHLCKPPAGQVQLLGGKQCTWGPSYWCTSPQHADACNALVHCQTKVWMKSEP